MLLKERNCCIQFLSDYPLLNKNVGLDQDHPYILKLPKSSESSQNNKLSILSDSMFKTMFMNSKRIKYSCKLISYLLEIPYEELLENLRFSKNELDKEVEMDKGQRSDYVSYIKNSAINIEINTNGASYIIERNMDYLNHLFSEKVKAGSAYKYTQVIQININNFAYVGKNKVKYSFYDLDKENTGLSNKKIIIQIYIPNLMKKLYNEGIEKLTETERFLLVTILPNVNKAREIAKGDEFMNEFIDDAIYASKNNNLKEAYDKEWALRDLGYTEGWEDGIEEGIKKGKANGIEEGIQKIARNLKNTGLDIKMISANTGLSIEQIEKL